MKPWKEITHYAGFDWAHDHHNVVIVDRRARSLPILRSNTMPQAGSAGASKSPPWGARVAVCVETSQGMVIEQLLRKWSEPLSDFAGEQ